MLILEPWWEHKNFYLIIGRKEKFEMKFGYLKTWNNSLCHHWYITMRTLTSYINAIICCSLWAHFWKVIFSSMTLKNSSCPLFDKGSKNCSSSCLRRAASKKKNNDLVLCGWTAMYSNIVQKSTACCCVYTYMHTKKCVCNINRLQSFEL